MPAEEYRQLAGEFLKHGVDPIAIGRDFVSVQNNDFEVLDENLNYCFARGLQLFEIPRSGSQPEHGPNAPVAYQAPGAHGTHAPAVVNVQVQVAAHPVCGAGRPGHLVKYPTAIVFFDYQTQKPAPVPSGFQKKLDLP